MSVGRRGSYRQVVARVHPALPLFVAALLLVFGAGALNASRNPSETPTARSIMMIIGIVCMAGVGISLWWGTARQIVASDRELRWRHWFGWTRAHWEEVLDYHLVSRDRNSANLAIVTTRGTVTFDSSWLRSETLQALVARNAHAAAAREWGLLGNRVADPWPRIFHYHSPSARRKPWMNLLPGVVWFAMILFIAVPKIREAYSDSRSAMEWLPGVFVLAMSGLLVAVVSWPHLVVIRDVRGRRRQKITATPESILYEDGERRIEAPWTGVLATELKHLGKRLQLNDRLHVVSTTGGVFDFTPQISGYQALRHLIDTRAVNRGIPAWQNEESELAATPDSISGKQGGTQAFHYRTREMRALLRAAGGFVLFVLAVRTYRALFPRPGSRGPDPEAVVIFSVIGILFLLFWLWYRKAEIRITDQGLAKTTLLGTRFLPWSEIREYYRDRREGVSVVKGRKQQIRFRPTSIVGRDTLQREIARRATAAETRQWEDRPAEEGTIAREQT